MILYLRIVHSVDFYNHSEYPNEDEMPNRCGILHARGIPPPAKVTSQEVEEYMKTFEKKMGGFLVVRGDLTPEEAAKFGLKVEVDEVEKFIAANTQELGKVTNHSDKAIFVLRFIYVSVLQDKWLCPLSGKKFKGPDFVRKHIMTKHTEKVDEVKKEVNFFNNYLRVRPVFNSTISKTFCCPRTQSAPSCPSTRPPRPAPREREAQVRTGGREGGAILMSTGNFFFSFLLNRKRT